MFKAFVIVVSFALPSPVQMDDERGPYATLPECLIRTSEMIKDFVNGPFPVTSINGICVTIKSQHIGSWTTNR
tara:strand:- start:393 stop:611 length:219 start_codon:yes stop_codon:yes gene_type:complete